MSIELRGAEQREEIEKAMDEVARKIGGKT